MNSQKSYFQKGPSSGSITIVTCQNAKVGSNPGLLKQQSTMLPLYHVPTCGRENLKLVLSLDSFIITMDTKPVFLQGKPTERDTNESINIE